MKELTTTEIGRFGEDAAAKHLKKNGFRILERNFRASHNEIDIIASSKDTIVFVEVKTRTPQRDGADFGTPAEAVTYSKQKRTIAAARAYLYKSGCEKQIRFDVIEVYLERSPRFSAKRLTVKSLEHIVDAFSA